MGALANAHFYSALYYALAGDRDQAEPHRQEVRALRADYSDDLERILQRLEAIRADPGLARLFEAIRPLYISIESRTELPGLLKPLYDALEVSPGMSSEPLQNVLVGKGPLIAGGSLISADDWSAIYLRFIKDSDRKRVAELLNDPLVSLAAKAAVRNVFQCSFINLVGKIVLEAHGFKTSLIVTADKVAMANMFKRLGEPEHRRKPNHVLVLATLNDGRSVFFDLLNGVVSVEFSLADDFLSHPDGYHEMLSTEGKDPSLYRHFVEIPEDALSGQTYFVLGDALKDLAPDLATQYVKKSLSWWPNNFGAYSFLAGQACSHCLSDPSEIEKAMPSYEKSMFLYPKDPGPYDDLCLYYHGHDRSKSSAACARSIELWGGYAIGGIYDIQARNLYGTGALSEVRDLLTKARAAYQQEGNDKQVAEMEKLLNAIQ